MIQVSIESAHALTKVSSIEKLPISKVENSLKSNFDPNKPCKIVLTHNN